MDIPTAERGIILAEALEGLPKLKKAREISKPKKGYIYRVMSISIYNGSESGGESEGEIKLDLETAKKIIDHLELLLPIKLRELGFEWEKKNE